MSPISIPLDTLGHTFFLQPIINQPIHQAESLMSVAPCLVKLKWIHKLVDSDTLFTIVLLAVGVVLSCSVL